MWLSEQPLNYDMCAIEELLYFDASRITYIGLSELFQLAYNTYAYVASKTYWERWTNCLVLNYAGFQCRFEGRFVHTIQLI